MDTKPVTSNVDVETRRAYSRWHYRQNKELYKIRAKEGQRKNRRIIREHILSHLREHPCIDCGEQDLVVLEFDHRPDEVKLFNLADAVSRSLSLSRVKAEIAKCDVRCANCHKRATFKRADRVPGYVRSIE